MESPQTIFPVCETIEEAWQKVKGSKWTFISGVLTIVGIILLCGFLGGLVQLLIPSPLLAGVFSFIAVVFQLILSWGLIYMGIQRAADQPIFYGMLKIGFDIGLIGRMIGLYILQLLVFLPTVILPLLTLVIDKFLPPSSFATLLDMFLFVVWDLLVLFLAIRMILSKAFVIVERKNPIDAIKISFKATKNYEWRILGYMVLSMLILLVSVIPVGIGLIWSVPFMLIAYGLMYRKLAVLRPVMI